VVVDLNSDPLVRDLLDNPGGGKVLGDVVLKTLLGKGGMGAVYRGRHSLMNIDVAVKVMLHGRGEKDDLGKARFQREANLAAQIDHPNVIRVMNMGSQGPILYIVMEFIEGCSCDQLIRDFGLCLNLRQGRLRYRRPVVSKQRGVNAALSIGTSNLETS
jgi:serine/threonine protein kinase